MEIHIWLYMKVIAHRGFADKNIENSIQSIKSASKYSDIIEIDVRVSKDGVPVVFHDTHIDDKTNSSGLISEQTYEDIIETKIENSEETIPTLSSVLDATSKPVLVELKSKRCIEKIYSICSSSTVSIQYQSFNPSILKEIPDSVDKFLLIPLEEHLSINGISKNSITNIDEAIQFAEREQLTGLSIHYDFCSKEKVQKIKLRDFSIYIWTINNSTMGDKISQFNVDGIITNHPDYL